MSKPDLSLLMKQLENEGFLIGDINQNNLLIAFISLRKAFQSWFSSYSCFKWNFRIADVSHQLSIPSDISDPAQYDRKIRIHNHTFEYFECYSETILHFHHFIELVLKELLRQKHELFASNGSNNPLIYYQLLVGEKININDLKELKSIEFSETLRRLICLIDNQKLDLQTYNFLKKNKIVLDKLNNFRNRLVHKGTFVLPYAKFDEYIGKYLLQIIINITNLSICRNMEYLWKYQSPLHCGLDPLDQLENEFINDQLNYKKIAYLKELGKAAYQNPYQKYGLPVDKGERDRAHSFSLFEFNNEKNNIQDILSCPVCGVKSLIRFFELENENPDPENLGKMWLETIYVKCLYCSFEVTKSLSNASELNLSIPDYWIQEELK